MALIGGSNLTDPANKPLKIVEVFKHPQYKPSQSYHDIALLKLEESAKEKPICVWSLYAMDDINVTAIGYGHTQFGNSFLFNIKNNFFCIVMKMVPFLTFSR